MRNHTGQILVIRRSILAPMSPLQWDLPGGIVDPGESPKDTAIRETREETGLNLKSVQLLDVMLESAAGHSVVVFYGADAPSQQIKLSHEHDRSQWLRSTQIVDLKIASSYKQAAKIFDQR